MARWVRSTFESAAAVGAIVFVAAAVALSSHRRDPLWVNVSLHLVGLTIIVAGLLLRLRPVSRRLALLAVALGLAGDTIDPKGSRPLIAHHGGSCLYFLHLLVLGHLVLAYPSGPP